MKELDVTQIEGRLKHATIFQLFDELKENESFVIKNDHDPKPLFYTFQAERAGSFDWEYLEEGPEWWKVRLGKLKVDSSTIGDMVAEDFRKAEVFRKFGIDFCCGGQISLTEACEQYKVNIAELQQEFLQLDQGGNNNTEKFNDWKLDFLSDYIINNHHAYVVSAFPLLLEFSQRVVNAHGDHHPEVKEVASIIRKLEVDLMSHLKVEEEQLFPLVKELVAAKKSNDSVNQRLTDLKAVIKSLDDEHIAAGSLLKRLSEITNNYTAPADACPTFTTLYAKLNEFELDLHQHIHLENNILFQKAVKP